MSLKKGLFKHKLPQGELNVVSLMDILTTLLFFLLLAASFTRISALDASGFLSNKSFSESDKKPFFTLEVIVHDERSATVWLGPLTGLKISREDELTRYLGGSFSGDSATGYLRKVQAADLKGLVAQIQQALVPIKASFPDELTAVIAFTDTVSYQTMVDTIAAVKSLDPQQGSINVTNAIGQKERTKILFPQLVISEWSEGA
jgi:hypothetical protein